MNGRPTFKLIFEKVIGVFAWICLLLTITLFFIVLFSNFTGEQNGKSVFGYKFLIVNSNSMSKTAKSINEEVFFEAGDVIVIKTQKDPASYSVGNVITYVSNSPESYGKTVTHKIRQVVSENGVVLGYVTYGINTGVNDSATVPLDNILGIYVNKIPNLGNFLAFFKTSGGYFLLVLIPSIFLIVFFSIKVGKGVAVKEVNVDYESELNSLKNRVDLLETALKNTQNLINDQTAMALDESAPYSKPLSIVEQNAFNQLQSVGFKLKINCKKISFTNKLLSLSKEVKDYYNYIYNEFISYKNISDRLSFKGISFRKGRKLLAKITVRGKTLTLYLSLNASEFNKNVYFQKDVSAVKAYSEVPFMVKVKSQRGLKNALTLINILMKNNDIEKNLNSEKVNSLLRLTCNLEEVSIDNLTLPNKYPFFKNAKKISFETKLKGLKLDYKEYCQKIREQFKSHNNISERLSFKGISFRKGRKLLAKITVRGKTLTLYLSLNASEFNKNVYFQKDVSAVKAYSEVPFMVKVKSRRGLKNALTLIEILVKQNEVN